MCLVLLTFIRYGIGTYWQVELLPILASSVNMGNKVRGDCVLEAKPSANWSLLHCLCGCKWARFPIVRMPAAWFPEPWSNLWRRVCSIWELLFLFPRVKIPAACFPEPRSRSYNRQAQVFCLQQSGALSDIKASEQRRARISTQQVFFTCKNQKCIVKYISIYN